MTDLETLRQQSSAALTRAESGIPDDVIAALKAFTAFAQASLEALPPEEREQAQAKLREEAQPLIEWMKSI